MAARRRSYWSHRAGGLLLAAAAGGFGPGAAIAERTPTPDAPMGFDLLDWASQSGQFDALDLPTLPGGWSWDTAELYTTGEIRIVPEPATLALLALSGLALVRRRRK